MAEIEHYSNHHNLSIGRAVPDEWVEEVADVFRTIAPTGVKLILRHTPAINYIDVTELKRIDTGKFLGRQERASVFLGKLTSDGQLMMKALTNPLPAKSGRIEFRPSEPPIINLWAKIPDSVDKTGSYANGYVISGEKLHVRRAANLSYEIPSSSGNRGPLHVVKAGIVEDNEGLLTREIQSKLKLAIPKVSYLHPIAPIEN
ncbi:MAG: hypothetical protein ACXWLH_03045 [Candidatus Saccharimonadales bacterium]